MKKFDEVRRAINENPVIDSEGKPLPHNTNALFIALTDILGANAMGKALVDPGGLEFEIVRDKGREPNRSSNRRKP